MHFITNNEVHSNTLESIVENIIIKIVWQEKEQVF